MAITPTLNTSGEAEVAPPSSVSVSVTDPPTPADNVNGVKLHAVYRIMQEKELGKTVIALAIPIAMAAVVAGKDKLAQSEVNFVLILTSIGFAAILNGILLKDTYAKFARIVEAVGIVLVAVAFFSVVSFFLPVEVSWVPAICIGFCLLPFAVAVWQP